MESWRLQCLMLVRYCWSRYVPLDWKRGRKWEQVNQREEDEEMTIKVRLCTTCVERQGHGVPLQVLVEQPQPERSSALLQIHFKQTAKNQTLCEYVLKPEVRLV
jgi:hypothetical protein